MDVKLNDVAVKIAVKILRGYEGLCLVAYPDPASPLSKALSLHGMLAKYKSGALKFQDLAPNFQALSGNPWTIGYGNTEGVKVGDVWTLERSESDLADKVRGRMLAVLKVVPKLSNQVPERIAACTSLAYNIGTQAFKDSTVAKMINADDHVKAADAFILFNKVRENGVLTFNTGLDNRRKLEADLYRSVR